MKRRLSAVSLAAIVASIGAPVWAQTASDSDEQEPVRDIIVVEGTKLTDSAQEVEVSVEVFTAERLDRERIVDVGDILLKTPNVSSRGGAGGSFTIRRVGSAGQGVTSNVYIDGAPLASNGLGRGPTYQLTLNS